MTRQCVVQLSGGNGEGGETRHDEGRKEGGRVELRRREMGCEGMTDRMGNEKREERGRKG